MTLQASESLQPFEIGAAVFRLALDGDVRAFIRPADLLLREEAFEDELCCRSPRGRVASLGNQTTGMSEKTRHARQCGEQVPRTLVFDEVDAGIGGAAGEMIGRRLKQISESNQVLCVTHLAQIAGFADAHYSVAKRELQGRTVAEVEVLTGPERVREIGRMISGQRLTDEALRHAEKLIEEYSRRA